MGGYRNFRLIGCIRMIYFSSGLNLCYQWSNAIYEWNKVIGVKTENHEKQFFRSINMLLSRRYLGKNFGTTVSLVCPVSVILLLFFGDNKLKMARKPGKKQKENPVGYTGKGKRWKGNRRRRGTENIKREPPVFEFGGEVTLVRLLS